MCDEYVSCIWQLAINKGIHNTKYADYVRSSNSFDTYLGDIPMPPLLVFTH